MKNPFEIDQGQLQSGTIALESTRAIVCAGHTDMSDADILNWCRKIQMNDVLSRMPNPIESIEPKTKLKGSDCYLLAQIAMNERRPLPKDRTIPGLSDLKDSGYLKEVPCGEVNNVGMQLTREGIEVLHKFLA